MSETTNKKGKTNYHFTYGNSNPHRIDEAPPTKVILLVLLSVIGISIGAFFIGRTTKSDFKPIETIVGHDKFKDIGMHSIHNGDCSILKEFLGADGQLHIEFVVKRKMDIQFELIDVSGNMIWRSPIMTDDPGHHELRWDPVHRDGSDLPPGAYSLAVEVDGERTIIGEFVHEL